MKRNCRQRLFKSAQSGVLLLLTFTPMTATSNPVGADLPVGKSLTQQNSETAQIRDNSQASTTQTTNVPPIPVNEIAPATLASVEPPISASNSSAIQEQLTTSSTAELSTNQADTLDSEITNGSVLEQANSQAPKESAAEVSLDSTQAEKTSNQGEVLVPSGAAIQSQLLPLGQASDTPWASYATMGFLILGMAATGLLIVKLRQGKSFGANKSERQMQIISSLALSPKRQLLLVKIRDKEVALASTESGITLLTELETPFRTAPHLIEDSGNEEPRRRKVQQKLVKEEQSKMIAASSEITNEECAMARSEMLMGALKNLREKSMRGKQPVPQESFKAIESDLKSESQKAASNVQDPTAYMKDNSKASPTLGQTRAAFPKYLANAFEKEANRPTAQQQNDEAGNVTNMIRERLKELRPLA